MTDRQLRDEVITFFLAGYEITGATLAWLAHTLTQHPEELRAVEAELGGLLGQRAPAFEDLMAMPYTRAVIQETLRLYAPSLAIPHTAACGLIPSGSIHHVSWALPTKGGTARPGFRLGAASANVLAVTSR